MFCICFSGLQLASYNLNMAQFKFYESLCRNRNVDFYKIDLMINGIFCVEKSGENVLWMNKPS